jgi:hypothetical protein
LADLRGFYPRPDRSPLALFHPYHHFGYSLEHLAHQVALGKPFLVGISANFSAYAEEALALARAVKKGYPKAPIVVGGHHATALPRAVLAEAAVDYVICGEGEAALTSLATALKKGADPHPIPGLGLRTRAGDLHLPGEVAVADLDRCPPPALDLIDRRFYRRRGKTALVVAASRGCPFACSYCCMTREGPLPYRQRSVAGVLAELEVGAAAGNGGVGFIDFEDENLALDKGWLHELLAGIERRFKADPPELRAMNGLYPPSLDRELVAHMARAGFKSLNLALVSTASAQLERFNRPDVSQAFDRCLAWAADMGMDAVGYLICGAPHQRPLDSLRDLIFLAQRRVLAGVSVFYPAPGSRDYDQCARMGCLPPSFARLRSSALPVDHATSRLQSATLMRLGRLVNFIKALIDKGEALPPPAAFPTQVAPEMDRHAMGRLLVAGFLADQKLRGIDMDGRVYDQPADPYLCARFHKEMRGVRIYGVTTLNSVLYPE